VDNPGSISSTGKGFPSFPKHPDWLWGPPNLLFSGYCEVIFMGIKWLEHEADHSPPSISKVKKEQKQTSSTTICRYTTASCSILHFEYYTVTACPKALKKCMEFLKNLP
jgi:hypothetical protein